MIKKLSLIVLITFTLSIICSCKPAGPPEISIKAPRLVGKGDVAVFMIIFNDGESSDMLIGCSIKEYPEVKGEIHDVIDGVMKEIGKLKIPSDDHAILEPGSLHLMFFGLPEDIGNEVTVIVTFQKSGSMEIKTPIRS